MSDDNQNEIVRHRVRRSDRIKPTTPAVESKKETQEPAWMSDKPAQAKWRLFFIIFIVGIILDQATKYWIWFNILYPGQAFRRDRDHSWIF